MTNVSLKKARKVEPKNSKPKGKRKPPAKHIEKERKKKTASSKPLQSSKGRGKKVDPTRRTESQRSKPKSAASSSSSLIASTKVANGHSKTSKPLEGSETTSLDCTIISSTAVQQCEQPNRVYLHAYEDPNWLGNEDETGSVASGLLEEDFCQVCGLSTLGPETWNSVVLCDICEGEYHLHCIGLSNLPQSTFICSRCEVEEQIQSNLRYTIEMFPLKPPKPDVKKVVVYTPARPLETAFKECEEMGIMLVSNVFDFDLMRVLTHGTLSNTTKSGRIVEEWLGVTKEVDKRLSATTVTNIVDREGRYDLKLPDFVIDHLQLPQRLEPILTKLRVIMGSAPKLRTHNIVFVPVGSKPQEWHCDHSMVQKRPFRYFTILIHLNSLDNRCGGTEIWIDSKNKGDLVRARPGDALVFHGSLLHRGLGNSGFSHRFFYYASYACDTDVNDGTG